MQAIRENIILFVWGAIAYAIAFYSFNEGFTNTLSGYEESDTTIYFSFTKNQKYQLEEYFQYKYTKQKFNGAIIIGQKDSVFFEEYFGYADYLEKDSIGFNSVFQLASVSKQFTAVAILQLYQKGLLKLNDSIQKYFPLFPYDGVTIQQLLTHRSGLPNYHYFFQHIPTTYDTILLNQNVVDEMIEKVPKTYYNPDRRYHYSNTGYALLASIVENITKTTFSKYIHTNIFEPLEMNSSFTYSDIIEGTKVNTKGYLRRWRQAEYNYLDGVLGDKGIYCSALDLFKWDQGLYSGKIINIDTLNLAFQPMGKPKKFKSNYGYGWRMYNWGENSTRVLFHAGWWHGYRSLLIRIPKDSTTILVLKNRSKGASVSSKKILQIMYPDSLPQLDTINSYTFSSTK